MGFTDRPPKAVSGLRDRDQVDVIGHEVVGPDCDVLGEAELGHELQVALIIFVTEERLLPAVSPLRQMVKQSRSNHTSKPSHLDSLLLIGGTVKN